jgi:predicted nucleic acid-binding protein
VKLVVSDTTPLNYLILIGHVDVLPVLFSRLVVPPAVIAEMRHPKTTPSVAAWANSLPAWVEVKNPRTLLGIENRLGPGEREALSLALELKSAIRVDERFARTEAKVLGVPVIGTLALLDLADQSGLLDFDQVIALLQATTFRVEKTLIAAAIAKVRARKRIP